MTGLSATAYGEVIYTNCLDENRWEEGERERVD